MNKGERSKLAKTERITGEKRVESLFTKGHSFVAYPFRVVYATNESDSPAASILVSIPKKKLKRAVDRNRMKRLTREAYRLHKHELMDMLKADSIHLDVAFIYVKDELSDYVTVEKGIVKAIRELGKMKQATT